MATESARLLRMLDERQCRPIVVASFPRSGTHLCIDTLRLNFPACRSWKLPLERADALYANLDVRGIEGQIRAKEIASVLQRVDRPLVKTHALPGLHAVPPSTSSIAVSLDLEFADWLTEHASFVYTYRDGREALRSLYQMLQSEPNPIARSFSDFIRQRFDGRSRVRLWAEHVKQWLAEPNVLHMEMSQLRSRPREGIDEMSRNLSLQTDRPEPALPPCCGLGFFERLRRRVGRHPLSTAIVVPAGPAHWREIFTPADREFFQREAGDLLIRLGFESSDRWVDDRHLLDDSVSVASAASAPSIGGNRTPVAV